MLHIRRRTDAAYRARPERARPWLVDFRAPDGTRVRFTLPAELSRRDAESVGRARWLECHAPTPAPEPEPDAPTWIELANRYYREHGQHTRSLVTLRGQLAALTDVIGETTPLDQVDLGAVAEALRRRRPAPRPDGKRAGGVPCGAPGANRILNTFRAVLRHNGLWTQAWAQRLKAVKLPERIEGDRSLSASALRRLEEAAAPHLRLFIAIAVRTGLREGAILALDWRDIDFDRGVIEARSKSRAAGGKPTPAPLTAGLRAILEPLRQESGPVVTYQNRRVASVRKAWVVAREKAGLPDARIHDLRHTFASQLAAAGRYDLVSRALAHGSGRSVTDRYIGGWIEILRAALEEIERGAGTQRAQPGS